MPWRLVIVIVIFAVFLAFVTFNLDNRCDVSFGFYNFENVPVFLTIFFSFALGLLCFLPYALRVRKSNKKIPLQFNNRFKSSSSPDSSRSDKPSDGGSYGKN